MHGDLHASKARLVLGLLVLVCSLSASFLLQAQSKPAKTPVRVAIVSPMTGDDVSVPYRMAVTAALQELTGGELLGRPIQVSYHDDRCMANIAEKVAHDLVQTNPPQLVIGHSCSAATLAAAPIYAAHPILQITPDSTHTKITELGIHTLFRMVGHNKHQGQMAARRIAEQHSGQKVGVLHTSRTYAKDLASNAINALQALGIEPALVLEAERETGSYLQAIQALMDAEIEVLYLVGGALDSGIFMRQLRLLGSSIEVLSGDTLFMDAFLGAAESAAEGVTFSFIPDFSGQEGVASARPVLQAAGMEARGYSLLAYAAVEVWLESVKRAQSLQSDAVAAALRGAPIDTVIGSVHFDAKGDIITSHPPFIWYQWQSGEPVPVP